MSNFDDMMKGMSYDELLSVFDNDEATASRMYAKYNDVEMDLFDETEEEWSDEDFEVILNSRPNMKIDTDRSFTALAEDVAYMSSLSDVEQECVLRWRNIEALRDHYALFEDFLYDCMTELMGFKCTELQIDIGNFLSSDVRLGMVQAQRSQAKSTIVAMFAVWQLIHDCKHRVLIISAGSDVAMEIANWVIQIINGWEILECMRPDRQHGDRSSSKAFDINWQLKGAEKSPSVACIGVTANMQGRRADLLIPDDIESSKNGSTEVQRQALIHLSRDFTSICQNGRIMYLGTPQTIDSIYNDLPDRGYTVRVWTGRVPNDKEAEHYGDTLAPFIRAMMRPETQDGYGLEGNRGAPTDPVLLDEEALTDKEKDQGASYFNLQHMLNTELSDEDRHPLKPKNLIVMGFGRDKAPGEIEWMPSEQNRVDVTGMYSCKPKLYRPFYVSPKMYEYEQKVMYVDPAGGGADAMVAAVGYLLHGYIFIAEILKMKGGYSNEGYVALSELAYKHKVNMIEVEENYGKGALAAAWRPVLRSFYNERGSKQTPPIEDIWESGQKELRIIDNIEPIMGRHRLIIHEDVISYDVDSVKKMPIAERESYKLIHQLAKITRDRGALIHDDALDAVGGVVRHFKANISVNEKVRMEQKETDDNVEFMKEWGADIGNSRVSAHSSQRLHSKHQTRPRRLLH